MSIVKFLTYSTFIVFPNKQVNPLTKLYSGAHEIQYTEYGPDISTFSLIYRPLVII